MIKISSENAIPNMTSNTSPTPYIANTNGGNVLNAYLTFNRALSSASDGWFSDEKVGNKAWLSIKLATPTMIGRYTLHSIRGTGSYYMLPRNWTIECSDDNVYWEIIDEQKEQDFVKDGSKTFDIANPKKALYYRINMTKANEQVSVYRFGIGLLEMFEVLYEEKVFIKSEDSFLYLANNEWVNLGKAPTEQDYIDYGISDIKNIPTETWKKLNLNSSEIYYYTDLSVANFVEVTQDVEPFSVYDHISDTPEIIIYNESTDGLLVSTTVEPFSVYDYISETPTAIAYTESTDDITVSTTTEPYDLYDEFGNELEVLYYTDDEAVTEADLILEANWSPIDELEGDFEVVTWTDEPQDTAQRVLEMTAIPKPQFVKMIEAKSLTSLITGVDIIDNTQGYKNNTRFLIADSSNSAWYSWSKTLNNFAVVNVSNVLESGMTADELNAITTEQWALWTRGSVNIGVYMYEDVRGNITSEIENVSYQENINKYSPELSNLLFYILNTTAKIQIELDGNVLKGEVSDDDMTRVQYRILLNGLPYFPESGDFTALGASPVNIEVVMSGENIRIDEENTVRVEFKDSFGTVDYWQTNFTGMYAGLLFKDVYGDYYSNDVGEVLKYLDFGTIIAGQTTIEHEVLLKNQSGFDIANATLKADTSKFPQGLNIEFSSSQNPFLSQPDLTIDFLENNKEKPFFVRLKSQLGVTPVASGEFAISAKADRA